MKGESWSKDHEDYIKANYKIMTSKAIASHLGRTDSAVRLKASRMGLERETVWTEADIEYIKANYEEQSAIEIAKNLKKNYSKLLQKAHRLGLSKPTVFWSKEEIAILKKQHKKKTPQELAEILNRTDIAITIKVSSLKKKGII